RVGLHTRDTNTRPRAPPEHEHEHGLAHGHDLAHRSDESAPAHGRETCKVSLLSLPPGIMSSARRHGLQLAFAAAFGLVLVACGDNAPAQRPPPGPPPPAKVPLRRLTNAEYAATVADLFPGATLPEMVFVPDA